MKTIVIDGIFFQINEWSGIAKLWRTLLVEIDNLLSEISDIRVFLLIRGNCRRLRSISFKHINVLPIAYFDQACALSDFHELGELCKCLQATVFISSYYTLAYGVCNVGMAYDFIPEAMGWINKDGWQNKEIYMRSLSRCLSISQSTARQASLYYPNLLSGSDDIFYPPMAKEDFERPLPEDLSRFRFNHQLLYPYTAILGHRGDYKNGDLLTTALENRSSNAKPIAMGIVTTSGEELSRLEQDLYTKHFQFGIKRLELKASEMPLLLRAAEALFYPSLLEGFGYPVAEALAQECPVITTGATSIGEILTHADPQDRHIISGHDSHEALNCIIQCLHTGRRASRTTAERIERAFSQSHGNRFLTRLLTLADTTLPPRTPPELEACLSLDGVLA